MRPILGAIAVVATLAAPSLAASLQRHFESPITESVWRTAGTPLECRLSHEIPEYGRAVFTRHAGGALDFHLDLVQRPGHAGQARIRVVPPPWKHDVVARDLGTVAFADRSAPFRLRGDRADVLMASLEEGLFPTFSYSAPSPVVDSVSVSLSSVNFLDSLEEFRTCGERLMDSDFSGIRDSRILFAPGSTALDAEARSRLDQIVTWMKLDPGIASARIAGHTDASGNRRENYLLSQQRARTVRAYLTSHGVDQQRLRISFHGEERPLSGSTDDPRQNRRVEVTLYR